MRVMKLLGALRFRRTELVSISDELRDEPQYVWPEDPDEVPAWRVVQEQRAAMWGITLPPYRTRRQFELAIEVAETRAAISVMPEGPAPALAPSEAARRFLSSLQHDELVGEYTAPELSALYSQHCADDNLTPAPIDLVKGELVRLPGVHRKQADMRDPVTGKRQRPMMWFIAPLSETNAEEIPFDIHPDDLRMAA